MSKKNVYLVDMGAGSNMHLTPLSICMVGDYSLVQDEIKENFNIEYRYLRQNGKDLASSMSDPVIIGFSCYVWNANRSFSAARETSKQFSQKRSLS